MWLLAKRSSPSHVVYGIIKKSMSHLIARGATIEKVSDTHLLIQDIDEWLWKDAQKLEALSRDQLVTHVYASVSTDSDNLNGIVVSIQIIENSTLWVAFESAVSVLVCVVLFLWIKYVYLLQGVFSQPLDNTPPLAGPL